MLSHLPQQQPFWFQPVQTPVVLVEIPATVAQTGTTLANASQRTAVAVEAAPHVVLQPAIHALAALATMQGLLMDRVMLQDQVMQLHPVMQLVQLMATAELDTEPDMDRPQVLAVPV